MEWFVACRIEGNNASGMETCSPKVAFQLSKTEDMEEHVWQAAIAEELVARFNVAQKGRAT